MAESKANSSSMAGGPYSRGHDDHHSVNFAAEAASDGAPPIDITKSHFGESGMSEFNKT